jgi:hypothetical protein
VVRDPTSASEIRDAIGRILAGYSGYAANARACHAAEFDFETTARDALAALRAMASPESEPI